MKLISTVVFIPTIALSAISIPNNAVAECPSQLTPDDMHECIMMEGNGEISYREWAPEFYMEFHPEKSAAIKAAYEAEDRKAAQKEDATEKPSSLTVSSTH